MKTILIILSAMLAGSALAGPVIAPDGAWLQSGWPTRLVLPDRTIDNLSPAECVALGYSEATPAAIAARNAQIAADQEAAQAEAALFSFPYPSVIVPVIDVATWQVVGTKRMIIDAETGMPLYTTNTASPQRDSPTQMAGFKAEKAKKDKARQDLLSAPKNFNAFIVAFTNWMAAQ